MKTPLSRTWKLILEYDGTRYSGWQEQKNARTVQGELRAAAEGFLGVEVELQGSGRTDAGVHASAQVAHLRAELKIAPEPQQILYELNQRLPADIAVLDVTTAPNRFHARHDAVSRSYVYQIATRKTAFSKRYVWWIKESLDVDRMHEAAALIPGRHDFVCFAAIDPARPEESTLVVVESASVAREGDMILFRIQASHFLWRMVRRLAGTLVKVGMHEIEVEEFKRLLKGKCSPGMDVAAWTAPASGLFLDEVVYGR
jgi:tRNA pseudouridine38-40 synthase